MSGVFITILNMSITVSFVALAVMLVRLPLKKAPKIFSYELCGVVLFRLLCPFSIESGFSLVPTPTAVIPQDIVYSQISSVQTGMGFVDAPVNEATSNALPPVNTEIISNNIVAGDGYYLAIGGSPADDTIFATIWRAFLTRMGNNGSIEEGSDIRNVVQLGSDVTVSADTLVYWTPWIRDGEHCGDDFVTVTIIDGVRA